ncbi:hypothetical protein IWW45_000995 [Coemansia sp. RSA 485]|nr:hypothetical protein IWW45_000995 [Coemansia sp. RSA 485]
MLSPIKLVPLFSLLACAFAGARPEAPIDVNVVQAATSTAPQFGFNAAVPTGTAMHHAENMYVMPAATEFKGVNPSDHVQGIQRQEQHTPVANNIPAAVTARDQPQVYEDGKDTTWMFFPRPQNVKMTPEQEQQWMQECQRVACQKMNAAMPSDKANGQSRIVAVPTTPKEQAELQKEIKQIFGKNVAQQQGPNGVEAAKGRPDGKNLCCCCCCPCCCCCCPCCCCCKCCCCKCCCCCCPCCCC